MAFTLGLIVVSLHFNFLLTAHVLYKIPMHSRLSLSAVQFRFDHNADVERVCSKFGVPAHNLHLGFQSEPVLPLLLYASPRLSVTHTHTHTERERERERDRQTDRQTDSKRE